MDEEKALIEAILFLETAPIEPRALGRIAGLSTEQVRTVLAGIKEELAHPSRGLELSESGGGISFQPKRDLWPRLKDHYGKKHAYRLSRAAMETLSIIAYSQPVTRGEIESLRGVAADAMIRQLVERDLVREVGRKEAPGRPVQFGTTREFLKRFGLSSISDLPKLDEIERERFNLGG